MLDVCQQRSEQVRPGLVPMRHDRRTFHVAPAAWKVRPCFHARAFGAGAPYPEVPVSQRAVASRLHAPFVEGLAGALIGSGPRGEPAVGFKAMLRGQRCTRAGLLVCAPAYIARPRRLLRADARLLRLSAGVLCSVAYRSKFLPARMVMTLCAAPQLACRCCRCLAAARRCRSAPSRDLEAGNGCMARTDPIIGLPDPATMIPAI